MDTRPALALAVILAHCDAFSTTGIDSHATRVYRSFAGRPDPTSAHRLVCKSAPLVWISKSSLVFKPDHRYGCGSANDLLTLELSGEANKTSNVTRSLHSSHGREALDSGCGMPPGRRRETRGERRRSDKEDE